MRDEWSRRLTSGEVQRLEVVQTANCSVVVKRELNQNGEVFHACPTRRRPGGSVRTRWRDYISWLACEYLGVFHEELEEVAG